MPTANPPPISETELHAYVDGETFPERQAIIERWLARNPLEASRVTAWRRQNQLLRATFGRILSEPLPAGLAEAASPTSQNNGPVAALRPVADVRPMPGTSPWDARDRLALIAAGSFLAGAGVACLAGYWIA